MAVFCHFFGVLTSYKTELLHYIPKYFSESYTHNNILQFSKFRLYSVILRGSIFQKYDKKIRKNRKNIENLKFNYRTILKRYEKRSAENESPDITPQKTIYAYLVTLEIKGRKCKNSYIYRTCR